MIGDLDSTPAIVLHWLADGNVPTHQHPRAKDETDLELALLYAVSHFDDPIRIFGALGGRLDQELANILLLAHPALRNHDVRLVEQHQQAWLVRDTTTIVGAVGDTVSLIPLAGDAHVAQTTGLDGSYKQIGSNSGRHGASAIDYRPKQATITLQFGMILCVHSSHEWQR